MLRIVRPIGNGSPPVEAAPCTLLPPPFKTCAPLCCPPPQCGTCEPKTRITDALRIAPEYDESRIKVGTWGCDGTDLAAWANCIELRIMRRGWCDVVLTLKPYRATEDGHAVFKWDDDFWLLGEGYYEADVVVNGRACLTIGLWVPHCRHRLWTFDHSKKSACEPCPTEPGPTCPPALIDPVPNIPIPDGACNVEGCQ